MRVRTSGDAPSSTSAPEQEPGEGADPAVEKTSPFAGVPVGDYVRDGVAAVLLLVSLALPWDIAHRSSDKIEVVLVTVLSLLSLTLPYLARTGALPASWTVHTTRRARLFANAPYVLVALVYLVLDGLNGGTANEWGWVGTGVALGLAGSLLAAQPREAELGPQELDGAVSRTWSRALLGLGGLLVVTVLVTFVLFLTRDSLGFAGVLYALVSAVFVLALVGLPLLGVVRRSESGRLVLVGLGIILVVAFVLGSGDDSLPRFESLHEGRFGLVLVPAIAAIAASPAVRRLTASGSAVEAWTGVAVRSFDLLLVVAGYAAVVAVLALVEGARGVGVVLSLVFGLLVAGVALVARRALSRDAVAGRVLALGAAGLSALLGLVLLVVVADQGNGLVAGAAVEHVLIAFGLPLMAAFALTVPPEVRAHFAENLPPVGEQVRNAYVWQPPAPKPVRPKPEPAPQGAPVGNDPSGYAPQQHDPQAPQHAPTGQGYAPAGYAPQGTGPQPVQPEVSGYAARPGLAPSEDPATQVMPAYSEEPAAAQHQPAQHQPQQYQPQYQPQQAGPQYQPQPQEPQPAGFSAAQALDPGTPLEVLAQIVQDAPHLRPQVAANPSTYPALLDWLGNLGDPAVDAALRSRGR
ncbi:hypothetical protein [Oerskovia flava]|uniref:DUF7937 domain-containing protein n=1 Tax=Oerskovia flava TaxID=2986422 RepID=UPI00223F8CA8|nr:hypothetical protein [Oerskovia sp. JB1-3-2]